MFSPRSQRQQNCPTPFLMESCPARGERGSGEPVPRLGQSRLSHWGRGMKTHCRAATCPKRICCQGLWRAANSSFPTSKSRFARVLSVRKRHESVLALDCRLSKARELAAHRALTNPAPLALAPLAAPKPAVAKQNQHGSFVHPAI